MSTPTTPKPTPASTPEPAPASTPSTGKQVPRTGRRPKRKTPVKRKVRQVVDTIQFEWIRNLRKTLIVMAVLLAVGILNYASNAYQYSQGVSIPDDPVQYARGYLSFFKIFVNIIGAAFGGSLIATDFEKQTGNLLFPKISRDRLLLGRVVGNYALTAACVGAYYVLVAGFTMVTYEGTVPRELAWSFGWALLYTLAILSFVTFFSSFMRSTSFTLVVSLLLLLIVFDIVASLVSLLVGWEPLFILTYYANILTSAMDMPEERLLEQVVPISEGQTFSIRMWLTPSVTGALVGMLVYTSICLVGAYLLFKRRQAK